MGSSDCSVGSSQGNPARRVPMVRQCDPAVEHRRRGMFPSMAEEVVVVVKIPSLRCVERVRGRETHPSLRLILC